MITTIFFIGLYGMSIRMPERQSQDIAVGGPMSPFRPTKKAQGRSLFG
jgi:hypothetical protein